MTKFFKIMKTTTPLSIKFIFIFFCMLTLGNIYSQDKNTTTKKFFGQTLKSSKNPNSDKIRCVSTEYEQFLQEKNPKRMSNAQFETWLAPLVSKYKATKANSKTAATIITIPVVVHVVHNGQIVGIAPNITDAQVQSQITVLNQDFRRMLGTPGYNTNPVGADVEIEFVLAQQDPSGNPTNGIDRVSFLQSSWSDTDIENILKPATIWDPTMYLNMWSLKFTDNTVLGYAQFPDGSGLAGLNSSGGSANTDGVVSSYDVFGSKDYGSSFLLVTSLYNKGRTMSHEVGHWLGLLHIWGDGGSRDSNTKDCNASDYCADTPQAGWENYDCNIYDSCPANPGNDMVENYMDYTNDDCMNIFTQNQKDRIAVIMNNAARRSTLKTSTKDDAMSLFATDAEVKILSFNSNIDYGCATPPAPTNKQVSIYNRGTSTLTSVTLNYNINGGSNQTYTWSGSLTQNQFADITLPNTNFNGTLNVSIATSNGGTDQRTTNNTASKNYFNNVPTNYNYTNYVFRLQQDLWGSETTWSLKNSSGTTLYSGGPYEDKPSLPLPSLITENWTLPSNQCYTFTINDSQSDGICCGTDGNGYYDIKTNNGAITVKSGSSFSSSESITITNNTLGTDTFEALNEIYLYPNPTKGILNVSVPSNFGLPTSLTISNSLGQIISRKAVSKADDLTLNTSSYSKGIYFITVTKDDQAKTLQFIKD